MPAMQLPLLIGASLFALVQGSRYGLLRVGSSVNEELGYTQDNAGARKSLFEEDFSL